MTDKTDADGGPAFPVEKIIPLGSGAARTERSGGMSLRDFFAAHSLAGMLASESNMRGHVWPDAAQQAYAIADAMLAARKGGAS